MSAPTESSLESRLAELAGRAEPSADGWEQIQARARRHDHRRRVGLGATLSLVLVLAAIAIWPRVGGGGRTPTGVSVQTPSPVAPATSPPRSEAAWVAGRQVWLFTGSGSPRAVAGSSPAADPTWSHDGQWVSYLRFPGQSKTELWVVRPDGSGNRRLWTGKVGGFAWSPTADELAVSAAPAVGVGGLIIAAVDGTLRTVVTETVEVNSFAWSPDGQTIAYAEVVAPATTFQSPVKILIVNGPGAGNSVTAFRAPVGDGVVLAGWWPHGDGLLYWVEPQYSKSLEADGLPLTSVALSGEAQAETVVTLTTTLVSLPWVTWAPDGQRVLVVSGSGRLPSQHKSLSLCTPSTGACASVPTPAGTVALDPAWSPDGRQVAFVVADSAVAAGASWYRTRRLWVAKVNDPTSGHPVAGAPAGAAVPSWSADGGTIRYTTSQAVEVISALGGQPQVVSGASPLTGTPGLDGPTAYGKAGWTGHAVWAR